MNSAEEEKYFRFNSADEQIVKEVMAMLQLEKINLRPEEGDYLRFEVETHESLAEAIAVRTTMGANPGLLLTGGHKYIPALLKYYACVANGTLSLNPHLLEATLTFIMSTIEHYTKEQQLHEVDLAKTLLEPAGEILLKIVRENRGLISGLSLPEILLHATLNLKYVHRDVVLRRLKENFDDLWYCFMFEYQNCSTPYEIQQFRAASVFLMVDAARNGEERVPAWLLNKLQNAGVVQILLNGYPTTVDDFESTDKDFLVRNLLFDAVEILSRTPSLALQFVKAGIVEKTGLYFKTAVKCRNPKLASMAFTGLLNIVGPNDEEHIRKFRAIVPFKLYGDMLLKADKFWLGNVNGGIVFGSRFYINDLRKDEICRLALMYVSLQLALKHLCFGPEFSLQKYSGHLYRLLYWNRYRDILVKVAGDVISNYPPTSDSYKKLPSVKDLAEATKRFMYSSPSNYKEFIRIWWESASSQVSGDEVQQIPPCFDAERCATCGEAAALACGGCNAIRYCDRDCQKWDRSRHKRECKAKDC